MRAPNPSAVHASGAVAEPTFLWDERYETGIALIDQQHQRLVELLNRFGAELTSAALLEPQALEDMFAELSAYADHHFRDEEGLMAACGVDLRHQEAHRRAHRHFLQEITRLHNDAGGGNTEALGGLLRFLTHWLTYHILGMDHGLARQMQSIHAGVSPEQAYADAGESARHDRVTSALLSAMNGLFQEVSSRNSQLFELNRTLEARVAERTEALTQANAMLEHLALTDTLTELPNRRHVMRSLADLWSDAVRRDLPLSLLMIDADYFKTVNDTYGHDAGNEVLLSLSQQLRGAVRTDDIVARLGGDEFCVVCGRTGLSGAMQVAHKLLAQVKGMSVRVAGGAGVWNGSVSVGVAARSAAMDSLDELIKAADAALYHAKRHGRGRVAGPPEGI